MVLIFSPNSFKSSILGVSKLYSQDSIASVTQFLYILIEGETKDIYNGLKRAITLRCLQIFNPSSPLDQVSNYF